MQNLLKEAIRRKRRGIVEVDPSEIEEDIAALEADAGDEPLEAEDEFLAEMEGIQEADDIDELDEEEIEREEEESGDLSPTVRDEGEESEDPRDADQEAIILNLTADMPEDVLKRKPNKSLTERIKEQAFALKRQSKKGQV